MDQPAEFVPHLPGEALDRIQLRRRHRRAAIG